MKKITLFTAMMMLLQIAFAGGILTNSNQSAQFVRMLSRNASTQIDAVYFNPAGVIKLEDGFHFAIHNQSIFQTRTIVSDYPFLHNSEYEGDVAAPVFPSAFAVYKKDKLAFSLGFGPNGGGGSADYKTGLPSFEKQISDLVPGLAGLSALGFNVSDYAVNISFEGTSVFWGIQGGITYGLSDAFSVYGGVRYMPSVNTYSGYMEKIAVTVNGQSSPANSFMTGVSNTITNSLIPQINDGIANINQLNTTANSLLQIINGGGGEYTLAQLEGAQIIDAATRVQLEAGLAALNIPTEQIPGMSTSMIQGIFAGAYDQLSPQIPQLEGQRTTLEGTASDLNTKAAQLGDKEVDVKQTGAGITPIIGINISPVENLNIGIKYEFQTTLKLTNETTVDGLGMFPDGQETRSDVPAILSVGADYGITDNFNVQLSFTNYFDKNVNWGKNIYGQERTIDGNSWELALGLQYSVSDNFAVSLGAMSSQTNVSEQYQSDFSYSNPSYTGALGFEWKLTDALTLDAGFMATNYVSENKSFGDYSENYDKATYGFAFGICYSIFQ